MTADDWQPMETAPRDGTRILIGGRWSLEWSPGYGEWTCEVAAWGSPHSDGSGRDADWYAGMIPLTRAFAVTWTHWQPLPAPPDTGG